MITEFKQKTLCPRDDVHYNTRPNYLWNRRIETWEELPSWGRYCKFVRDYAWKWGFTDMEVIEMYSHCTIKEWAELLEWDKKIAMNPWL